MTNNAGKNNAFAQCNFSKTLKHASKRVRNIHDDYMVRLNRDTKIQLLQKRYVAVIISATLAYSTNGGLIDYFRRVFIQLLNHIASIFIKPNVFWLFKSNDLI